MSDPWNLFFQLPALYTDYALAVDSATGICGPNFSPTVRIQTATA
jgi:hypothetical protein